MWQKSQNGTFFVFQINSSQYTAAGETLPCFDCLVMKEVF